MPTKKKSAKKVEADPLEGGSEGRASGRRGANLSEMVPREAQIHIFKGITELALAMDSIMPRSQMPEEVRQHAKAAKREILLMFRGMIDASLNEAQGSSSQEPKLRKIDVE